MKAHELQQAVAIQAVCSRCTPEWEEEGRRLTTGRGVDHVIEVAGPGTLARSMKSVALYGHIALIGVPAGVFGKVVVTI